MEEIHFKLETKEYLSGLRSHYLRTDAKRSLLIFGVCAIVFYVLPLENSWWLYLPVYVVAIMFYVLAYWFAYLPYYARKAAKILPLGFTECTLRFGNGVIETESSIGKSRLNWLADVLKTPDGVLLYIGHRVFFPVPIQSFRDAAQLERFLALAQTLKSNGAKS